MSYFPSLEDPSDFANDIVAGHALGLIDDYDSGSSEGIIHSFQVCRSLLCVDILHGLDALPSDFGAQAGSVVTIGVFDGVHRGHQLLIEHAVLQARRLGVPCVVMTFDPHPLSVFMPERAPVALLPLAERARRIEKLGVDMLLVIDFRRELAGESPQDYFSDVLVGRLHARHIVVGENFTFGKDAVGTARTMQELGHQHQVEVSVLPLLSDGDVRVCSTQIRHELAQGNIDLVNSYLGHPFAVVAPIERGAGRGGRELGYPTANQYVEEVSALPEDGVYAGWLTIIDGGEIEGDMETMVRYPAAISVGTNPTFGDSQRSVESYILDRDADLYGRVARVEFIAKVRPMLKFHSVEELLENMSRDVAKVRDILGAKQ